MDDEREVLEPLDDPAYLAAREFSLNCSADPLPSREAIVARLRELEERGERQPYERALLRDVGVADDPAPDEAAVDVEAAVSHPPADVKVSQRRIESMQDGRCAPRADARQR